MQEVIEKLSATSSDQRINRIPLSTYRLQLGSELTLGQVRSLLPYLDELGISDLYLSPLFRARTESSHGYDVVDHGTIDPAIGDIEQFQQLAETAQRSGMGIVLDVVPNHMGINDPGNAWWLDVLENGEGAYFAEFFDIDWRPAASALQDKILLPFLGDSFGAVLERGELQIVYANERLQLQYFNRRFPLAPTTWPEVLELVASRQGDAKLGVTAEASHWLELQSITLELRNLPARHKRDAASMEERYREQAIARRRLAMLLQESPGIRKAFHAAIQEINGEPGNAASFDRLEQLLEAQWYRLSYWRVAVDEINYRRFFDVNDLAAIRVEDSRVFDAVHRLIARLMEAGWVTGLRIDHPDGLLDPQNYFKMLHSLYRTQRSNIDEASQIYVVAEKILSGDEALPTDWEVSGTTGYDLLNLLGRLQIDDEGLQQLRTFYDETTDNSLRPLDVIYESKRTVLFSTMASELQMLAARLYRIAQGHRASRDFTRPMLQRAIREIIACMSVYRTYVRNDSWDVAEADYRVVATAVRMAKRRNRSLPASVFDYIASVLLLEHPPTITHEQAAERREFALKFQQVSGPVTAKGVEDTAFYRYYPLASLNEVGGELDAKALPIDEFHRLMRHRMELWPHSMSGTATHDTKRGEDTRARLHVLSEIPDEWSSAFNRWCEMNWPLLKEADGDHAPDINEQYLLYQTLVGTWPVEPMDDAARNEYRDRIIQYMGKALSEGKVHTSWMNPSEVYETAIGQFITELFGPRGEAFRADLSRFVANIADAGFINSLSQLLLKLTVPGIPDFYQGTELWDFSLVDPDNRCPVDFKRRSELMAALPISGNPGVTKTIEQLAARWPDSRIKLWITTRGLHLRRRLTEVFTFGDYIPLLPTGSASDHLIAFARRRGDQYAITVAPRHYQRLLQTKRESTSSAERPQPFDNRLWSGTSLELPDDFPRHWRCHLTEQQFTCGSVPDGVSLAIDRLFQIFPFALLTSEST